MLHNKKRKLNQRENKRRCKFSVRPVAVACYKDGSSGVSILFEFIDRFGKTRMRMISISDAMNLNKLKSVLVENNFLPLSNVDDYKEIQTTLLKPTEETINLVRTPGFYGCQYLLSDNTVIRGTDDDDKVMLDESIKLNNLDVGQNGSLKEWQDEVAKFAIHSSRLMLAVSSALSSSVLHLSDIESGGFHYSGKSSTGKSTSLYFATSVQGPRRNMGSWDITETSVEEFAAARNDSIVTLDELKLLDKNPQKAAEKASLIAYRLTAGKAKMRSKYFEDYTLEWRIVVLSTGEESLTENAQNGGAKRMLGEEVRFVDIPADAGKGMGIYESLPDNIETPNELAEMLNSATNEYYGVAQKVFLERLTAALYRDKDRVKARVDQYINHFMEVHKVDKQIGHIARLAKRFALAYAGGLLAVKYKVLPFTESDVMAGISECYLDALKVRPASFDEKVEAARKKLRTVLRTNKGVDIRKKEHGYSCNELKSTDVFRTYIGNKGVKILTSGYLLSLVPENDVRKHLLAQFKRKGFLYCDADGKSTRQFNAKIANCKLSRGYAFLVKSSR